MVKYYKFALINARNPHIIDISETFKGRYLLLINYKSITTKHGELIWCYYS